jgi:hypothetical protein
MEERYRPAILFWFGIGLLLYLCFVLRQALLLIYVSVLIAVLLYPLVQRIQAIRIWKWRPGVGSAVLLLFGAVLGLVLLALIFFVPQLLGDIKNLQSVWPQRLNQIEHWIHRTVPVLHLSTEQIDNYFRRFAEKNFGPEQLTTGLIDLGTTLLAAAYFMVDGKRSIHWLVSLFPVRSQARVHNTLLTGRPADAKVAIGTSNADADPWQLCIYRFLAVAHQIFLRTCRLCMDDQYYSGARPSHHSHCRGAVCSPGFFFQAAGRCNFLCDLPQRRECRTQSPDHAVQSGYSSSDDHRGSGPGRGICRDCRDADRRPDCRIDLGPDPRIHRL